MNLKKRGLGRGLDVLLGDNKIIDQEGLRVISINKIQPGSSQPRVNIGKDSIESLSNSIKSQGLMQPILVRKSNEDKFEIIAGERRWRASKLAGLREVPVIIKNVEDSSALAMALVENLQREDLNSIDEAKGIERLIKEFGLTHSEAANSLGKSRSHITNTLRLLNSEKEVQKLLLTGKLEQGHVRALLTLSKADQIYLANTIVLSKLSVREAEKKVRNLLKKNSKSNTKEKENVKDRDYLNLEQELSDLLNLPVKIKLEGTEKGKVVISFSMIDELEGFLEKIKFK